MTETCRQTQDGLADRLVLGSWGIAGPANGHDGPIGYGMVSKKNVYDVLSSAWHIGVRIVDTCSSYGDGRAFELLRGWRERNHHHFALALKVGRPVRNGIPTSQCGLDVLIKQAEHEQSVLGHAAAILIKDPPIEIIESGGVMELLEKLADRFPTARVGIASHRLKACGSLGPSPGYIAQIELNAINRCIATDVAVGLRERGWEVWAMQPLAYGFLGSCEPRTFPTDDWRSRLPLEVRKQFHAAGASFLAALQERFPMYSIAQFALGYCLQHRGVDRVVIGPRSKGQLHDILAANKLASDPQFLSAIADLPVF